MTAMWPDELARAALPLAGSGMLVLALALLVARRVGPIGALVAAQAMCLALAALAQAWLQANWQGVAVAALALAVKAIAVPRGLRALAPVLEEGGPAQPVALAAAGVAVAGLALAVLAPVAGATLATALAVVLAGWLAAALRRDPAGQVAGVLVIENGLVLALVAVPVFPGMAAVALATLALPAAMVWLLVRRLLAARATALGEAS